MAKLRVFVFFSGGASGLRYLATEDPNYGEKYEVVGAFTDVPDAPGAEFVRESGVPLETNDLEEFYEERGAPTTDLDVREEFDAETREKVAPYEPDVVLLSGYMRILTSPVVSEYPIVNVHPADLRVEEEGERAYTGFDPVRDAVLAGEDETRSSVHLVTEDVDDGPLLVVSPPFPVEREMVETLREHSDEDLDAYLEAHQEWMKWRGDGPALAKTLELVADGRADLETGEVDGERAPFVMER
ncbi:MAG: formyltransferase family protein [Halobacteriales archaeon]|nr:formyltransferase family protein [Halobacteriales archaeon]